MHRLCAYMDAMGVLWHIKGSTYWAGGYGGEKLYLAAKDNSN